MTKRWPGEVNRSRISPDPDAGPAGRGHGPAAALRSGRTTVRAVLAAQILHGYSPRQMFASIPGQFESITPTWLTGCLHEACTITDAAVTDVLVDPIGIGVGFLGQLARLQLTYDRPTAGPRTLIGKLPTLDPRRAPDLSALQVLQAEHRWDQAAGLPLDVVAYAAPQE
jgi:hypothetical protein